MQLRKPDTRTENEKDLDAQRAEFLADRFHETRGLRRKWMLMRAMVRFVRDGHRA